MEKLTLLLATILVIGQGVPAANAGSGQKQYTPEQIKEMPRYSSIENRRCPKSRYHSVKKRLECKREIRIQTFEKIQARQAQKAELGKQD